MISWFLYKIGVREVPPPPIDLPSSPFAERHLAHATEIGEQTLSLAEREVEKGRQKLVSWQDLYDPGSGS